jgi:hypothetical protein
VKTPMAADCAPMTADKTDQGLVRIVTTGQGH